MLATAEDVGSNATGAAAADAVGWPDHVPAGLFEAKASGRLRRQMLRTFELTLDLNRPSQPYLKM